MERRKAREAKIDVLPPNEVIADPRIQGLSTRLHVETRHHFETGDGRWSERGRESPGDAHRTVNARTHPELGFERLEVNVTGARIDEPDQNLVHEGNDVRIPNNALERRGIARELVTGAIHESDRRLAVGLNRRFDALLHDRIREGTRGLGTDRGGGQTVQRGAVHIVLRNGSREQVLVAGHRVNVTPRKRFQGTYEGLVRRIEHTHTNSIELGLHGEHESLSDELLRNELAHRLDILGVDGKERGVDGGRPRDFFHDPVERIDGDELQLDDGAQKSHRPRVLEVPGTLQERRLHVAVLDEPVRDGLLELGVSQSIPL